MTPCDSFAILADWEYDLGKHLTPKVSWQEKGDPLQEPTARPAAASLLSTKFFVPRLREGSIPRPKLVSRFAAILAHRLTLVSAPAGFGKSSALAEWIQHAPGIPVAWLSLGAADNDPARFLSYVIAALQKAVPGVANDLASPLRSPQPPPPEAVAIALLNELALLPNHLVLILDDYHTVTSTAVNATLTFFLEHLPPNLHIVISTRADPPIPIARLRSWGQVAEIRTDDLRFTPDEAAAFLSQTMGLALSAGQVATLDQRAEGWIAGLQMAALSLRGREDVDSFIRAFAGTHRFVMDYLLEEVLAREPQEVQHFLLQTAILTRLSGSLCDAVTGGTGGQEMLEGLERRNLFVVPLDDDRHWYRYHHLFADLLQARLYQAGPDSVARLLSRAADWCEGNGQVADAVGYALAAKDYGLAANLVARHWEQVVRGGEIETVWSWLNALPEDMIRGSAPLGVAYCWLLWFRAQVGAIEPHLVAAERALSEAIVPEGSSPDGEDYAALPALIATLRSIVARYHGDLAAASGHAERALALLPNTLPPQTNALLRSPVLWALASAYDGTGEVERAVEAYAEMMRASRLGGSASGVAGATYRLTSLLRRLGRLCHADEACRESLRFLEEQGMASLPAAGLLHVVLSEMLLERNELEAAESHLSRGAELGRWSGRLDAAKNSAPALARLRQARQDAAGALAAVHEAEVALGEPTPPLAKAELLALKASILARQGSPSEAAQCIEEAVRLAGCDQGQTGEMVALAACRVRIAQRKPDEAVAQLTDSLAAAEKKGHWGTALELRILRSLALARQGNAQEAEADLERALALAEPEGYVRIFVDEGEPMVRLLKGLRDSGVASRAYLDRLLAAFPATEAHRSAPPANSLRSPVALSSISSPGSPPPLIEPLSERELEVLRLLAEGLTNQQIAARLIIALGTVKAHIHNISGKLGAQNRAHAVARAKELGLL